VSVSVYNPEGFALQIFQDRYAIHAEETFEQACERVAGSIADAEMGTKRDEYFARFLEILQTNRFSPGGRIWRGAGRPRGQMLNCFCIPAEDSREGWGDVLRNVTIISGTGGGVGINFSRIRPRGTIIRGTGGEATGAVSLMRAVNAICNELREGGGRRGALLFCLDWKHPDLLEFLEAKLDKKELTNANISVLIDNEFLKLVDEDGEIIFKWQGEERGHISAKKVWDKIIQNAWEGGDPGFLNAQLINDQNTIAYTKGGEFSATNPCFTGEMKLHCNQGIITMKELCSNGLSNQVITDNRTINDILKGTTLRHATQVMKTGEQQQIYLLITSHGHRIRCTEYHEFITPLGRRSLKFLSVGHELNLQSGEGVWGTIGDYEDGLILGSFVGDGTLYLETTDRPIMCLDYWGEYDLCSNILNAVNKKISMFTLQNDIRDYGNISSRTCTEPTKRRIASARLTKYFEQTFGLCVTSLKRQIPEAIWRGSRDMVRGYLAGIFQADGSVQLKDRGKRGSLSVRLSQSNRQLLGEIQILLNNFGIVSSIYKRRKTKYSQLPDGHGGLKSYLCKAQYELTINRPNAIIFEELIGFGGNKQKQLSEALDRRGRTCRKPEKFITRIKSIEPDGREDVYCLNEPTTHSLVVNGLSVGNCGEIPLEDFGCCCLGAINLHTHIIDGKIDWDLLEETTAMGVRFLDNVIDQNNYPLPIIEETAQKHRRIGLGVMGLHDMLLELGLKYSSEDAREIVDQVMDFVKKQAYHASITLAIEKGPFHAFDVDQHVKTGFVKKCLPRRHHRLIREHGIRNCALLTIAPTGCQKENTLIVTKNGILRLNELIDVNGAQWQSLNDCFVAQESMFHKADKGFVNGFTSTKKIKLSSGIIIEITPNHKIRIIRDEKYLWVKADDLVIGDTVPVRIGGYENVNNIQLNSIHYNSLAPYNLNKMKYPNSMSESIAWFLGLFYGDGSVHKKGIRIHCHKDQVEIHDMLKEIVWQEFGIKPTVENGKGKLLSFCFNSVELLYFLENNQLLKSKAHLVSIPKKIRQSSVNVVKSFIEGYWCADGSNTGNTKFIDTTSKEMAQDLAICLRGIGQNCRIGTYQDRQKSFGNRTLYRIYFVGYGTSSWDKWRYVNILLRKKIDRLRDLVTKEFVYDTIVEINDSACLTLDISVPDNNCYLAASTISHNTTSIVAGCSSGIEPLFQPVYERRFNKHKDMHKDEERDRAVEVVVHPLLRWFLEAKRSTKHFQGAHDIEPEAHLAMQAVCQRHIDNSISKTINLPTDYSVDQLSKEMRQYIGELKGITVYRNGSKGESPLIPLSLSEAKQHLGQMEEEASINDCPNGVCEIVKGGQ